MIKTSVLNLFLRGVTLAAKFLLVITMARLLAPELVGIYGLMTVTIGLSLFLLGMDFYAFNTREILERTREEWPRLIRDQLVFHTIMYAVAGPFLAGIFFFGILDWSYAPWFFGLVILEHLSQESFRLLVTLSRSAMANAVLFLRSGSWVFAIAALWWVSPELQNLQTVWMGWLLGIGASLGLAAFSLRDLPWGLARGVPIRWGWMRQGVGVALPLLLATIALQGTQFADRYLIAHFSDDSLLGVYTFFGSIANVLHVFVFTAVTMVLHPQIVQAYRQDRLSVYRQRMRTLVWATLGCLLPLSIVLAVGITPVLGLIGREIYSEQITTFYVLLAAFGLLTISHIPHYALYARKKDRAILASSVISLFTAVVLGLLLVPLFDIAGAAWATLGGTFVLGIAKLGFLIVHRDKTAAEVLSTFRVAVPERTVRS